MPSGVRHTQINLALALTGGVAVTAFFSTECGVILAGAAIVSDGLLSPDLDQEYSNAMRRWWILRPIWRWYTRLPHRSIFSHMPVLSDALRLAYLAAVIGGIIFAVGAFWLGVVKSIINVLELAEMVELWIRDHPQQSLSAFAGLSLATAQHCVADIVVSEAKGAIKDWVPKKRKKL